MLLIVFAGAMGFIFLTGVGAMAHGVMLQQRAVRDAIDESEKP